jgi:hypothetical protein
MAVAALALIALLATHPWAAGSGLPPVSERAALGPTDAAGAASGASPSSPAPTPTPEPRLYGSPPPASWFRPTWSVVSVEEVGAAGYVISQLPLEPRISPRTGTLAAFACDLGAAPDVGVLAATTTRLLGAVVPNAGHGWIRLELADGSVVRAFAVLVPYPPGTEDLAVGLFATSSRSLWPPGAYRFYTVDDTGIGRYMYACVEGEQRP